MDPQEVPGSLESVMGVQGATRQTSTRWGLLSLQPPEPDPELKVPHV